MKFGLNFTSCSENGYYAVIATTSGIYPKVSLLPVLSSINTIASLVKVKLASIMSSGILLLESRWHRADFFVHRAEADSLPR